MERMKYGRGKNMTNREGKVRDAGNTVKGVKNPGRRGEKTEQERQAGNFPKCTKDMDPRIRDRG